MTTPANGLEKLAQDVQKILYASEDNPQVMAEAKEVMDRALNATLPNNNSHESPAAAMSKSRIDDPDEKDSVTLNDKTAKIGMSSLQKSNNTTSATLISTVEDKEANAFEEQDVEKNNDTINARSGYEMSISSKDDNDDDAFGKLIINDSDNGMDLLNDSLSPRAPFTELATE